MNFFLQCLHCKNNLLYFCPSFLKSFQHGRFIKNSIFSQIPDNEVICICCKCKHELRYSLILKGELSDSYFNKLKKY